MNIFFRCENVKNSSQLSTSIVLKPFFFLVIKSDRIHLFLQKTVDKENVNDNVMICSERLEACSRRLINESGLDAGLAFPTVSPSFHTGQIHRDLSSFL